MISVRTTTLKKPLFVAALAAALLLVSTQAHAQRIVGNRNSRVATFGDIAQGKLRARVTRSFGLRFGTLGLFGDAEVFSIPSRQFRQFRFPKLPSNIDLDLGTILFPTLGQAGNDVFADVTFGEYQLDVALAAGFNDFFQYRDVFITNNEYSQRSGLQLLYFFKEKLGDPFEAIPRQDQLATFSVFNNTAFNQLHGDDFELGGGDFSFVRPIIPLPSLLHLTSDEFNGVTFDQYKQDLAQNLGYDDVDQYKNALLKKSEISGTNNRPLLFLFNDLIDEFNQLINFNSLPRDIQDLTLQPFNNEAFNRLHEISFLRGGGDLSIDDLAGGKSLAELQDFIDQIIEVIDPTDTPLVLADVPQITFASILSDIAIQTFGRQVPAAVQASASQAAPGSAANVSAVPEPASLGLMTLGVTMILKRSRRR